MGARGTAWQLVPAQLRLVANHSGCPPPVLACAHLCVLAPVLGVLQRLLELAVQLVPGAGGGGGPRGFGVGLGQGMVPKHAVPVSQGPGCQALGPVLLRGVLRGPPTRAHSVNSARSLPADMSLPRLSSTAGSFFLFSFIHRRTLKPLTCGGQGGRGVGRELHPARPGVPATIMPANPMPCTSLRARHQHQPAAAPAITSRGEA